VVVGIVVPEVCGDSLFAAYREFAATLGESERRKNEPKDSRLTRAHRRQFTEMLAPIDGCLVIPISADLSEIASIGQNFPVELSRSLVEFAPRCVHQSMRDDVTLLSRQAGNLSSTELLKLLLYTTCIQECIHHAVLLRSHSQYQNCWSCRV